MRKGVDINLSEHELELVEATKLGTSIKALLEFQAQSMVMGWRVANLLQRELTDEAKKKVAKEFVVFKKNVDDD